MTVSAGFDELQLTIASESFIHAVVDLLEVITTILQVGEHLAL